MLAVRGWEGGVVGAGGLEREEKAGPPVMDANRFYSGSLVNARRSPPGPRETLDCGCACQIPVACLSFPLTVGVERCKGGVFCRISAQRGNADNNGIILG